jgi:hypothetical protein
LFDIGQDTDNTVFALLVAGNKKLISIVQPRHTPHQLSCFDLQLLLRFCHSHHPGLITSELWFLICFSRFHLHSFLYAYTNCLDRDTNLMLILLSQENSTQQFQLFRRATIVARQQLGQFAIHAFTRMAFCMRIPTVLTATQVDDRFVKSRKFDATFSTLLPCRNRIKATTGTSTRVNFGFQFAFHAFTRMAFVCIYQLS